MASKERRPDLSTPFPGNLGKQSGSYRIDLSSLHPDESSPREPWAKLATHLEGQAELTLPDCPPLRCPLPLQSLDEAIVHALRMWLGDEAVRHWYALRRLRATQGRALWKLDAHLEAIGERRDDAEARVRAAREVERLTGLQVTVITPAVDLRLRTPLLVPVATTERNRGGYWLVDDMVLRVHPLLSEPFTPPESRDTARPAPEDGDFPEAEPGTARMTAPPATQPSPPGRDADDPTLSERSPSK
jgi:hypothetical protein